MSFTRKLQVTLGMLFMLATASAGSVSAQARASADSLRTTAATQAESTTAAENDSAQKLSGVVVELIAPVKNGEIKPDVSNSNTVVTPNSELPAAAAPAKMDAAKSTQSKPDDDKWQFIFSPYFWMAGLHGSTGGPNRTVQVDESFGDIFKSLKFAFMGVFEANKGRLAVQTDVEYVSLEDEKATPGPLFSNATANIKTFVFTPEVGYRFYNEPEKGSFVEVLGGTRIWHLSSDLTFGAGVLPAFEIKNSRTWVDAVAGLRGKAALSEKFFLMGRFDLGGGGSKFTYQLFGGLGYNINKKIALVGGYRALDVNYDRDNFVYNTNQRGPIVGVGFKF